MRKPVWRHDWAGWSGGWYPNQPGWWQASILGIYGFGYFVDLMVPVLGDIRVGFHTSAGMRNPYQRQPVKRIVVERAPWPDDWKAA